MCFGHPRLQGNTQTIDLLRFKVKGLDGQIGKGAEGLCWGVSLTQLCGHCVIYGKGSVRRLLPFTAR